MIALGDLHEGKNKVRRSGFASDNLPFSVKLILHHFFTQKGKNILILKAYQVLKDSLLFPSQLNKFTFQEYMSFEENTNPYIPVWQKSYTPLGSLRFIGTFCAALKHVRELSGLLD